MSARGRNASKRALKRQASKADRKGSIRTSTLRRRKPAPPVDDAPYPSTLRARAGL